METQEKYLAVIEEKRDLTPAIWTMIKDMAPVMHNSRLFGVVSVEQATAIMIKGYEVGFGFAASFDLIQVIQGKPGVSPRGCMALILNSPKIKNVEVNRMTDKTGAFEGYSCTMTRDNGFTFTAQFTLEDAKRAGLIKPDSGWEKYPENMCQWRAIGFCADVVAPDITSGLTNILKMPEQFDLGIDDIGNFVDVKAANPPQHTEKKPAEITLNDLVDRYGPEKIMEINDGMIPATQEEVNIVAEKLASVS